MNGERRVLDEYLSRESADRLRAMLEAMALFPAIFVELDESFGSSHSGRLHGAAA